MPMTKGPDPADVRKPWERKADLIFRIAAVLVAGAFIVAASLLGPGRIDPQIWFGVLLALLALGALSILSFPTSAGPMERPATPWPNLMKVIGLLMTGAAIGIVWTSGISLASLPAVGIFGPAFYGIGAFEAWRRGRVSAPEATA